MITMDDEFPMMPEREFGQPEHVPQVMVGFGMVPEQSKKTSEAGYPVFRDVEFCKIVIPGDKNFLHFQPATDEKRKKYPMAYAAFLAREKKPALEGMPIEQWPQLTKGAALTLKAANIPTVEALAAVHDGNIDKIGQQGREWRAKAQAFLALAKDTAAGQKLAAENQSLKDQIKDMQRQITELAGQLQKKTKVA